jgi:hypothetical protein
VLPSFETVFTGRDVHRSILEGREGEGFHAPTLSENDLLSSLKALSSGRLLLSTIYYYFYYYYYYYYYYYSLLLLLSIITNY